MDPIGSPICAHAPPPPPTCSIESLEITTSGVLVQATDWSLTHGYIYISATLVGLEPTTFECHLKPLTRSPMRYPLRHRAHTVGYDPISLSLFLKGLYKHGKWEQNQWDPQGVFTSNLESDPLCQKSGALVLATDWSLTHIHLYKCDSGGTRTHNL